jgi:rubrerythrin
MVDFVTAIATAGQAIGLVKELAGAQKAFDAAEWKLRLADLNSLVADLKNALVDANAEAKSKEDELKLLRLNFLAHQETVEVKGYRYDKTADEKPTGHPYCPVCIQKHGLMLHTTTIWEQGSPDQCPNCRAKYQVHIFG